LDMDKYSRDNNWWISLCMITFTCNHKHLVRTHVHTAMNQMVLYYVYCEEEL